jgi:hypothetical protein
MENQRLKYYPTTIEAVHLLVLLMVLQAMIDFPLALYDYYNDTNYLSNSWISLFSGVLILSYIFFFGLKKSKNKITEVLPLKTFSIALILPIITLLIGLQYLVGLLNLEVEKLIPAPDWFWELFEKLFNNKLGFWGAFIKVAIIAPIIEESLFRGIIMHGFMKNYKNWYSILFSAILFSVYHLNPWQMTYTFFLGLLLGWIMVRTHSLVLCIITHSINNLSVLLSITFAKEISESFIPGFSYSEKFIYSTFALITGIILIWLLTGIKRKKNLKTRII